MRRIHPIQVSKDMSMTTAHSAPAEQQDSLHQSGLLAQILAQTRIEPNQEG